MLLAATNVCDKEINYASCGLLRCCVIAFVCPVQMSRVIIRVQWFLSGDALAACVQDHNRKHKSAGFKNDLDDSNICQCVENSYGYANLRLYGTFLWSTDTENVSCWSSMHLALWDPCNIKNSDLTMETGPTLTTKRNPGQDHYDTFTVRFLFFTISFLAHVALLMKGRNLFFFLGYFIIAQPKLQDH